MKKYLKFFLVFLIVLCCLAGWIIYTQANCGVCDLPHGEDIPLSPPETPSPPSEPSQPSEPTSPSPPSSPASPSGQSTSEPSAPEVYQKKKTWTDALPKLPGYGKTSEDSPYGQPAGGAPAPAPKGPMVNKGLMDKIRSTPRAPAEEEPKTPPQEPKESESAASNSCGDCFLLTQERITPSYIISDYERSNNLSLQYEREIFNQAVRTCEEKGNKDCSFAEECPMERQIKTEYSEDLYGEADGLRRVGGVKSTVGIYFRCAPEPPESPFHLGGSGMGGGGSISLPSPTGESGSQEGGGQSSTPGGVIIIEEEEGFDGTVPPWPGPKPPSGPKPSQPPGSSSVPETQEETTQASDEPPAASLSVPQAPGATHVLSSEKPSGCQECFKIVLEMPFIQNPFEDFEDKWKQEAFNQAQGICQQACADKGCTFSLPCGEKPVEQQEIYPENMMWDPQTQQTSGMRVRIGIYYKCIPQIGEQTSQVTVPPSEETVKVPEENIDIKMRWDIEFTEKVSEIPPEDTFIIIEPKETPVTVTYLDRDKDTSVTDIPKEIVTPPEETVTVPEEDVIIPKEEVVIPPKESVTDIPKDHVTDIPKKTTTKDKSKDQRITDKPKVIPKEESKKKITDKPKDKIIDKPKDKIVDKDTTKDIDKPPKEVDYPPPKEEEECDCKYLDQEWAIWQTIEGKYVYVPDPKINYKIPIEGYKRRVELKAAGADEDILILRAEKTKDGERVCVRSKNVFSPDLVGYKWEIVEGPGNFKDGGRSDEGESVIYIPPDNLPFGEHVVVIETVIDDIPGKAPDEENKGKIRMLIKHREEEPDFYFIDFGVSNFAPVGGSIPPELPCACDISTEWKEETALSHNIVFPPEGIMYCPECTDIWIGNGSDVDLLIVKCEDPECGTDIQKFPIVDVWTHSWAANFGSYLDGNSGRKVLYKAPADVPPGPIPNETIILNTRDSGRQFVDEEPDPDRKRITIVDLDLVIHKPAVIDLGQPEIPEEDEFRKGSQTFVNLDNDDRDNLYDTGTTDVSIAGEDEMIKLTLKLKPKDINQGNVHLEALTGAEYIKVWREANKTTEYVLGSPLIVPNDFRVEGDFLVANLYVEGIRPHEDQRQTQLRMTYDQVPDCFDKVALTIIGIDKIEWIGKNNSRNDDNNLDADPNHPAGLLPAAWRVFPDARLVGGAVEGVFRDRVDVKATLTVKPIEAVNIYFDSFDVDDPTSDHAPVDNEAVNQDNRGEVPDRTGQFDGEVDWIKEQNFDDKEETFTFQVTHQPGDNFRVVGNGDPDFLGTLDNRDGTLGANNADKMRIVNRFVTGTQVDREVREPAHYASDVLTVWRFVNVELETMTDIPQIIQGFTWLPGNWTSGTIDSVTPNAVAGNTVLDIGKKLPSYFNEVNHYMGGDIAITGQGSYPVASNTANWFYDDTVTVLGIVPNAAVGRHYDLHDDDVDTIILPGFPVISAEVVDVYAKAYIAVKAISAASNLNSFVDLNLNTFDVAADAGPSKNFQSNERFWSVVVTGCFQQRPPSDFDPEEEGTLGQADSLTGTNNVCCVFQESIRDAGRNPWRTVAHEIGHLLNGRHEDGQLQAWRAPCEIAAAASGQPLSICNEFSEISLDKLRSNIDP